LFPAPAAPQTDMREQCYAIPNERKIKHPVVDAILSAIHGKVFAA
jgi:LysR family transcriptional activator of nhaA